MKERINGALFKQMVLFGAACINLEKQSINDLNVFPVPDGDTGTNMSLTIGNAATELKKIFPVTVDEAARVTAGALLRGARGNSGVILSLLFRGVSKSLKGMDEASGIAIANALQEGVASAYNAVMKPAEGTVLTVSRLAAKRAVEAAIENDCAEYVMEEAIKAGEIALSNTIDQNPVLKKAGVVDAGGKGYLVILGGMLRAIRGEELPEISPDAVCEEPAKASSPFDKFETKDPAELRAFLETMGDCVLVVDDEEIIKVHVHTEDPGNALEAGLAFGQLLTVKIENMKEQHRKAAEENLKSASPKETEELQPVDPVNDVGFVAVSAGDGLKTLFTDLGCGQVVSGGQTMNPSTEQLVAAVRATPAKTVLILPNNKNIILAAEQAVPLVTDRKVLVLPTKTVPQGLSALLAYNPDISVEENTVNMMETASAVSTGTVTYAARDSEFGGRKIHKDDTMGLVNGKLEIVDHMRDISRVCVKLVRSMVEHNTSFVTLIYGEGVTEQEANEVCSQIKAKIGNDVEVTLVNGGQPIYYYFVAAE